MRPVGVELFHADGRTDMTKLIVAFCNFPKAPEKPLSLPRFEHAVREHLKAEEHLTAAREDWRTELTVDP
jgi:hypothetical protein